MADQKTVIKANGVYKDFKLPHLRKNSIKSIFMGLFDNTGHQKSFESQHALKDISFEIKEGEFFGIVGRNGSGKSTLLKILAGIYQPTKGSIEVGGKLVPFIELGVGFNPELTGRENVYLNGALIGFDQKTVEKMYDDIVEFAELEKFMDQKLKNYSSGMQVRLAFSMAIRADADILLIDEVLAVGDADFQRKCFAYFRELKRKNKTVVFVSHDMSAVREYCDRAIMIEKSKVIAEGNAEQIAKKYTKMFMKEATENEKSGDDQSRWGNKSAQVRTAKVTPKKLTNKNEELHIKFEVTSSVSARNLIVGFALKAADGKILLGTNTKIEETSTGSWSKGQTKTITWSLPNIFSDGTYSVDAAVVESDGITVCDWYEDMVSFDSHDIRRVPYPINPSIKTTVSSEENA